MTDPYPWSGPLVARLTELADPDDPDRAAMADLRRGLSLPVDYTLSRVGWLFRTIPDDYDERPLNRAILATGLFAWAKGDCPQKAGVNFGKAFGTVPGKTADEKSKNKEKREKRFVDLLNTDIDDLPQKLRQSVSLLATQAPDRNSAGLDWDLLIRQLIKWDHPDRWVQKQWARGFWSASEVEAEPVTAE